MRLNNFKFLHRKAKGASLPIAVIASLVMVTLSLAAMQTASASLSTAQRKLREERCYELARSFALAIAKEIEEGAAGSLVKQGEEAAAKDSIQKLYDNETYIPSPITANLVTPSDVWMDRKGGSALYWFMRDFISGVPPAADMSDGKLKDNYKWLFDVPYEFSLKKSDLSEMNLPNYGNITVTLKKHDKNINEKIEINPATSKTVSEISKNILTALNGEGYGELNSNCSAMSYFDAMPYQNDRSIASAADGTVAGSLRPLFEKYGQTVSAGSTDEANLAGLIKNRSDSVGRYLLTIEVTAEYDGVKWTYPMEYNVSAVSDKFTADYSNSRSDKDARILYYFDSDGKQHFMLYVPRPSDFKLYAKEVAGGYEEKSFGDMLKETYPHLYNHGVFADSTGGGFLVHLGEGTSSDLPFMHYYNGFKPVPMCLHEYNAWAVSNGAAECTLGEYAPGDKDACWTVAGGTPAWNAACSHAGATLDKHWQTAATFDCKLKSDSHLAFQVLNAARVYYVSVNFGGKKYIAAMGDDVQMKFTPKDDALKRNSD